MKKTLTLIWMLLSYLLTLIPTISLLYGLILWLQETNVNWWGPATTTYTILLIIGIVSCVLSTTLYIKQTKQK